MLSFIFSILALSSFLLALTNSNLAFILLGPIVLVLLASSWGGAGLTLYLIRRRLQFLKKP